MQSPKPGSNFALAVFSELSNSDIWSNIWNFKCLKESRLCRAVCTKNSPVYTPQPTNWTKADISLYIDMLTFISVPTICLSNAISWSGTPLAKESHKELCWLTTPSSPMPTEAPLENPTGSPLAAQCETFRQSFTINTIGGVMDGSCEFCTKWDCKIFIPISQITSLLMGEVRFCWSHGEDSVR